MFKFQCVNYKILIYLYLKNDTLKAVNVISCSFFLVQPFWGLFFVSVLFASEVSMVLYHSLQLEKFLSLLHRYTKFIFEHWDYHSFNFQLPKVCHQLHWHYWSQQQIRTSSFYLNSTHCTCCLNFHIPIKMHTGNSLMKHTDCCENFADFQLLM